MAGRFGLAPEAEVTLEVNPARSERGDAAAWVTAGVTRLSIGAQSMIDGEIRALGRRHTASDVRQAVEDARAASIASVSLDLLYDIPGQTVASWARSLDDSLALAPDHLSLYALTLDDPDSEGLTGPAGDHLPTPRGARRWRERARLGQDEDRAATMYELAAERLAAAGWRGYEISNWARPGHESRHNLAYWSRQSYEAVGPGAHAFDGTIRRWNAADLGSYIASLAPYDRSRPRLPPGDREVIDQETARGERLVLGFRLDEGIPGEWAKDEPSAPVLAWARDQGLVSESGGRLQLTRRGRLLSNELFSRLV